MNYQSKVKEFQILGGEDFAKGVTPLRQELLKEEITELEEAIKANDRVEILDALCDIKYINDGTANLNGNKQDDIEKEENFGNGIPPLKIVLLLLESGYTNTEDDINMFIYDLVYLFNFTLDNFKTALDRVHESNMSKFCNTEQEAIESVTEYKTKGIDTYSKQNGDKWVVYRLSDNKILKSKYYKRVQLEDLV